MTEAREWISEGKTTLDEAWLQPLVAKGGEQEALTAIETLYGIEVYSLEQAYKHKDLREHLSAPTPIRRAWGVPGLMWVLLLDRLSNAQPYRACKRCGALISGRRHKRFCSAEEDPDCFQARRSKDKRQRRARGSIRT
jgi:hypothetical protein